MSEVYKDANAFKAFLKEGDSLPELLALVDQVPGTEGPQTELEKLADVADMFKATLFVVEPSCLF